MSADIPHPNGPLPSNAEDPQQRVFGVIDLVRPNRVAGWAVDRANSAVSVQVDIHRDGRLVQTVTADRHRPDLAKGGIGSGHYGFAAEIDPPLDPGFEFTLAATARAADGSRAALKSVVPVENAPSLDTRLLQAIHLATQALMHRPLPARLPVDPMIERLADMIARIEVMQARIEACMPDTGAATPLRPDKSLRGIVCFTALVALMSLGLGIASLWPG